MRPSPLSRGEKGGQGRETACCRPLRVDEGSALYSCASARLSHPPFPSLPMPGPYGRQLGTEFPNNSSHFSHWCLGGSSDLISVPCGPLTQCGPPPLHTHTQPVLCKSIFPIQFFKQWVSRHRAPELHDLGAGTGQDPGQSCFLVMPVHYLQLCLSPAGTATSGHRHIFFLNPLESRLGNVATPHSARCFKRAINK